ncbi:MAG TPA: nucleotidyltransferase domain-containing protein [Longimicrobiaceae bacterium]|nr:nucleotidyltransferase domain-containing protein [Longimicrobiaceae bacterium]
MGTISGGPDPQRMPPGIADALFGRVRQRVLALLFGHPERSFYANEIIGWVDAGSGAVQRELARMAAAGLLTITRIGRQKHYQANQAAPIFSELRGIVLKTSGLGDVLRAALLPLEDRIRAAFVFGSVARGSDTAASDVDLMVISDRLTYADLFGTLETASSRLDRSLNPTIYTSPEFTRRVAERNPFLTRVLAQRRIWIIGDDDALPA